MKKLATLIAGMLLVGGTMMAADWKYSGKVEWELFNMNNNSEKMDVMPDGAQWYILNISSQVTDQTNVSLEFDNDDDSTDTEGALTITHTPNDYVEVAVRGTIDTSAGMSFNRDNGGDTYIKLMPSEDVTVTLKPFDAGIGIGDEFETDDTQNTSGVEVSMVMTDSLTLTTTLNTMEQIVDGEAEDKFGLKVKGEYSMDALSLVGEFSMNTQADEDVDDATNDDVNRSKMAAGARVSYTMDALTLNGEFISVTQNKAATGAADESGIGMFAKASLGIGEMAGMDTTVYASYKMIGENLYWDDDYAGTADAINVIAAGMDNVWNGVTINTELELTSGEEGLFTDKDGKATDSQMTLGTTVEIEF